MKLLKRTLGGMLLLVLAVVLVKFNYHVDAEKRGFDFAAPIQWNKDYILLRLFTPATTTGVQDEIRKKRDDLLSNLSKEIPAPTPNVKAVEKIKEELVQNDKHWDKEVYFVERQGQAAYYKTVTAPRIQPLVVTEESFIVPPYLIYDDKNSRILRWVIASKFTTEIRLTGPGGKEISFPDIHSDSIFNELKVDNLNYGEWKWEATAKSSETTKTVSGQFSMNDPVSLVFYSDTQDSLDYHRKAIDFIQKLHAKQKIDVVVHGGDITSFGSNEYEMVTSAEIFSKLGIPGIFVKGNHDFIEDYGYTVDAPYYQKLFSMTPQGKEDFRVFTLGADKPIRLMALDTNFPRLPAPAFLAQDRLIRKTLQEPIPVIMTAHHGYFSKGWHGSFLGSHSETWIEALYLKLFQTASVPMTLTGHEHVYQRIVDENSKSKTEHVIAGTASAKILYPYFQSPGAVKSLERKRTVTTVEIKEAALEVKTYDFETGDIIDQFSTPF